MWIWLRSTPTSTICASNWKRWKSLSVPKIALLDPARISSLDIHNSRMVSIGLILIWACLTTPLRYTKTIKYPTVCPFYLIKWPFFGWSEKYINVTKNPPFLLCKLEYISYQSPRSLNPKFSLVLKIPVFKIRTFHFYLIKESFFAIFNFESL